MLVGTELIGGQAMDHVQRIVAGTCCCNRIHSYHFDFTFEDVEKMFDIIGIEMLVFERTMRWNGIGRECVGQRGIVLEEHVA